MSQYNFLKTIGVLPRIISIGMQYLGIDEKPGKHSNATIMGWAKNLALPGYTNDDIPWCGLYVAWVVKQSGREPVKNPLWARNWATWGVPVTDGAKLGDILVFTRPGGGGHVGFYIAEDTTAYHVLGGNQKNRVGIDRLSQNRCIAIRRPAYNNMPASVQAYIIGATGALSTNEA